MSAVPLTLPSSPRLRPAALDALPYATPFLALDLDVVERAYRRLRQALQ